MATRSTITVRTGENERKEIYCHWDGRPEHNGKILLEHYNTQERAEELINLGDLSILQERINPSTKNHSFENPEDGVCVAYGRDRNESDTQARIKSNGISTTSEDYDYLFENDMWFVNGSPLEELLKNIPS